MAAAVVKVGGGDGERGGSEIIVCGKNKEREAC